MENNTEQTEKEKEEKKKGGIFKLYRTRIAAVATAIVVGISSFAVLNGLNKDPQEVPDNSDTSITDYNPNYGDEHDHDHNHTYNPDDNTVVVTPTPAPSETEVPEENTITPGPITGTTEKPTTGTTEGPVNETPVENPHFHVYSQLSDRYVDNGDGTHTWELVGTCPSDGESIILLKGIPRAHTMQNIYDEDGNVIGEECAKGCGYKVVKEHGHKYEVTTHYEKIDENTHRLVTVKTCTEADCPEAERVITEYGMPVSHNYLPGITDPKTGDTIYVCKDCGHKKVVQKEKPPVEHEHDYSYVTTTYENMGEQGHRLVTIGTCPADGATAILKKGAVVSHTLKDVLDANGKVIGQECTADGCGYKKTITIEHGHKYEVTTHYENMGESGHRLVTVKTCKEPGCPEDERVITEYGSVVSHTLRDVLDANGKVIGQECTADGCGYKKTITIEHGHKYEVTTHYENMGESGHRLVTVKTCKEPGCPADERVITEYGPTVAHTLRDILDDKGNVIGQECTADGCGYKKTITIDHEHKYTEQVGQPTYTDEGGSHTKSVTMRCPEDGDTTVIKTVESHSHTHSFDDETGHHYTCVCGNEDVRSHTWDEGREFDDVIVYTCTECGFKKEEEKQHEHKYTEQVGQPTYTDEGGNHTKNVTMKCPDDASTTVVTTTESHSHTHSSDDEAGHHYTCVCGNEDVRSHTWDEGREFDGVIVYTCTECGFKKEEEKQHEHKYTEQVGQPTYTDEGGSHTRSVTMKCPEDGDTTVLESTESHSHTHSFDDDAGHHYTCVCGNEDVRSHTWDSGRAFEDEIVYTCTECGAYRTEENQNYVAPEIQQVEQPNQSTLDTDAASESEEVVADEIKETEQEVTETEITEAVEEIVEETTEEPTKDATVTVQVDIPAEASADGEAKTVEFEVPESIAEQVMEEARESLSDALEKTEESEVSISVEEGSYEETEEDDKVLTLDNNRYYY